jgi:toxin ParE1/3/4
LTRSVAFRPDARVDLADIWSYSAERWGEEQADVYIGEIHAKIAIAADNPNLGSDSGELYPGLRRIKAGSHLIYYLASDAMLDIVRVLHQRRDPASLV